MWTRKDIDEFKANLLREGGEAVIKVNHGETVTVNIFKYYIDTFYRRKLFIVFQNLLLF